MTNNICWFLMNLMKGIESGTPWQNGPVPLEFAITGLGPIHIRIAQFDYFKEVLEKVMLMREIATRRFTSFI